MLVAGTFQDAGPDPHSQEQHAAASKAGTRFSAQGMAVAGNSLVAIEAADTQGAGARWWAKVQ